MLQADNTSSEGRGWGTLKCTPLCLYDRTAVMGGAEMGLLSVRLSVSHKETIFLHPGAPKKR